MLLWKLLAKPSLGQVFGTLPGAELVAFHLTDAGGNVSLAGVNVFIPASVVTHMNLTEAAALLTVFEEAVLAPMQPVQPAAAVSLNLFTLGGEHRQVRGLPEAVKISLPVAEPEKLACAYWQTAAERYSTAGLGSIEGTSSLLCETTHLTFFAALLKGFLSAFLCAQLKLLSAEGFRLLAAGKWLGEPLAMMHWLLLLVLLALMLAACLLDARSGRDWSEDFWLLPVEDAAVGEEVEEEQGGGGRLDWFMGPLKDGGMEVLDEVASRWFAYFGELRGLLESLLGTVEFQEGRSCGARGCLAKAAHLLTCSLASSLSRRQAATSAGLSMDTVDLALDDEDLGKLLLQAALNDGEAGFAAGQLAAWRGLHERVIGHVDGHWDRPGSWARLPVSVLLTFAAVNPLASLFSTCRLWTRTLRVLLFSCELLGTLMLAAVFFEASGGLAAEANEGLPECEGEGGFAEQLGQIIALGLASVLLAALPVTLLSTLHVRGFRRLASQQQRRRQLRSWRLQDALLWTLGLLYLAFADLFVLLFISNVASRDHPDFGLAAAIGFAEDLFVVPVAIALLMPLLAIFALSMASRLKRKGRLELLQQGRLDKESGPGNWYRVQISI